MDAARSSNTNQATLQQWLVQAFDWLTAETTHFKLYGVIGSILVASMFSWAIPFVGAAISTTYTAWGMLSLKKRAEQTNEAALNQKEMAFILSAAAVGLTLYWFLPPMYAGLLVLSSGTLGYYYVQDALLKPFTEQNHALQNQIEAICNDPSSTFTPAHRAELNELLEAGASPYVPFVLDEATDQWILSPELSVRLGENADAVNEFFQEKITAQGKTITLKNTAQRIFDAFINNDALFESIKSLPSTLREEHAKNALSQGLITTGNHLLASYHQALNEVHTYLRALAPITFTQASSMPWNQMSTFGDAVTTKLGEFTERAKQTFTTAPTTEQTEQPAPTTTPLRKHQEQSRDDASKATDTPHSEENSSSKQSAKKPKK